MSLYRKTTKLSKEFEYFLFENRLNWWVELFVETWYFNCKIHSRCSKCEFFSECVDFSSAQMASKLKSLFPQEFI